MVTRTLQLVLHYDGADFSGWQRQPDRRTVQGVLEAALTRLCAQPMAALGSGRTDTGVHARGQAVGVRVPVRWQAAALKRALNAVLPHDMWVEAAHPMRDEFHARFSATGRHYSYYVGTDEASASPFRRGTEWTMLRAIDRHALESAAALVTGTHCFRAFAVRGTAPVGDDHRCSIVSARWRDRAGGLCFDVSANRFLHHMVRFLVGTMMQVATGGRPSADLSRLLEAETNDDVSPPAPAHALFLDRVDYPAHLYLPAE